MTVENLIDAALVDAGVIDPGETPAPEERADGFQKLNDLLASLSAQALPVWETVRDSVAMTGAATYPLTTRPLKIKSGFLDNGGVETPYDVVTPEEWGRADRTRVLLYDGNFDTPTIRPRPAPSSGNMILYVLREITQFAAQSETISMPAGYQRALRALLAVELAASYGVADLTYQRLVGIANDAKTSIQGLNQNVLGAPEPAQQTPRAQ